MLYPASQKNATELFLPQKLINLVYPDTCSQHTASTLHSPTACEALETSHIKHNFRSFQDIIAF